MVVPFFRSHLMRLIRDAKYRQKVDEPVDPLEPGWFNRSGQMHPVSNNLSVGIWKGWNAAHIVSKLKGLPVLAWDGSIKDDEAKESKRKIERSSVKWSFTSKVGPLKSCSRKRKRVEMLNLKQQSTTANRINDSALAHPTAFTFDEMREEDIKLWKEGVDALSMHALVEVGYVRLLREFVGDDSYRRIVESLFRSIAKFVLSIFDKEDFERIYHQGEIPNEWRSFYSMLPDKIGIATKEEVVAKAVDTVIKESHRFPALTDHDFCRILAQYAEEVEGHEEVTGIDKLHVPPHPGFRDNPLTFPLSAAAGNDIKYSVGPPLLRLIDKGTLQEGDISKSLRNKVIEEVMQNFVPLKEYCKTQLGLELMCANGYRVFDTLVIEVLKDVKIDNLFEISHKVPELLEERIYSGPDYSDGRVVVHLVIFSFAKGLYDLGWFKAMALKYSQEALASCLSSAFGPCKAELIEVIKIADHERRLNNKRSISLENINYGLSLSRVGDSVKEIPAGSPLEFSIIEIFKLSRQKANEMGHKKVGLQHLILAVDTVLEKVLVENASLVTVDGAAKDLQRLEKRNINYRSVRSWKERSPMCRILHSRYRVFNLTYVGAGPPVRCVKRVRKCRRVDLSWIRKDRLRTPSSE